MFPLESHCGMGNFPQIPWLCFVTCILGSGRVRNKKSLSPVCLDHSSQVGLDRLSFLPHFFGHLIGSFHISIGHVRRKVLQICQQGTWLWRTDNHSGVFTMFCSYKKLVIVVPTPSILTPIWAYWHITQ